MRSKRTGDGGAGRSFLSSFSSSKKMVFEPLTTAIANLNEFYAQATTEMTTLLDLSGTQPFSEISFVLDGVNDFYSQAADQMAYLLDASEMNSYSGNVAGVSILVR